MKTRFALRMGKPAIGAASRKIFIGCATWGAPQERESSKHRGNDIRQRLDSEEDWRPTLPTPESVLPTGIKQEPVHYTSGQNMITHTEADFHDGFSCAYCTVDTVFYEKAEMEPPLAKQLLPPLPNKL